MNIRTLKRYLMLMPTLFIVLFNHVAICADSVRDVEQVLRDIHQDRPVPKLNHLKQAKSINADAAYYLGLYNGIEVAVETHPNSNLVASVLLKIAGPDQTREILPAVSRVLGAPHHSDKKNSTYTWGWGKYRAASVHYIGSGGVKDRVTIVSLYYQ